jgi:hypothetical protein
VKLKQRPLLRALLSLSKKSWGLLRAAALNPFFRLRRFIRHNGSPVSGGFSMRFAARESEGREAKRGSPSKNPFFDGLKAAPASAGAAFFIQLG